MRYFSFGGGVQSELEAWIDELGYEWREGTGYGLGAWVEVQP